MRITSASIILLAAGCLAAEDAQTPAPAVQPPRPPAAIQDQPLQDRIARLEGEIRDLVDEQARNAGPAAAAAAPDYNEAKARATADVRRRLEMVEYLLADNDYARAVDGCNAILVDHPHEPATTRLKYRILMAMVERERATLDREKTYRAEEGLADVQRNGIMPREKPVLARTVVVFDEDIEAGERAAVQAKLRERITLNYDGVKVGEVLKPLFAVAGINYVILDKALSEDTLTLHLVDDTVENALRTISKLVKVHYNYSASTVFIGAEDSDVLVSEVIRLESGLTDVTVPVELGQGSGVGTQGTSGTSGTTPNRGGQRPQAAQTQAQGQSNGGGQANSDIERLMEKVPDIVVGWPTDGKWYLDRKSNTLYVRATPHAIAEVKRLIRTLDYNNVQVLIEARFVEVQESAERELGVDWGGGALTSKLALSAPTSSAQLPTGTTAASAAAPATAGTGGLLAQILFAPTGSTGVRASIKALESEGKAQALAEPRILTLNNAVGEISLSKKVTYVKGYNVQSYSTNSSTTTNSTTTVTSTNVATPETEVLDLGINLKLIPSLARNSDVITLRLSPTVNDLIEFQPEDFTYSPGNGEDPITKKIQLPITSERRLGTSMHIKNGQTVVLGGLLGENQETESNGVPGLRKVPLVGGLFQRDYRKMTRSNLLIFVTAHIIDPSGAKIGEEVRRLRDTASVVLPEEARLAETVQRTDEARRAAEAAAAEAKAKEAADRAKTGPPTRGGRK